jgi:5-methylthioadenosine/S-adenosylhomocysteine deaminase
MIERLTRAGTSRRPPAILDVTVWTGAEWVGHQDVVIDGGVITEVRDHRPTSAGIDGSGGYLIPGFVNTHTHLQQTACRGVGDGQQLLAWLGVIGESMAMLTPERAYVAAVSGALEGLLSGTTSLVEHMWPHASPEVHDAVLQALDDVGVRAILGRGIADRADPARKWGVDPRLVQDLEVTFADIQRLMARAAGTRVSIGIAVPNVRALTAEGLRAVRRFADAHALPVSLHLLETTIDDEACRAHVGRDAVTYLSECNFLWEMLLAVHCVKLAPAHMGLMHDRGVEVSWNPVSNLRLGSGVAPVVDLMTAGIPVSVGVDGAASNDRQDMLESLRIGAYVQRGFHERADLFDFVTMLNLATTSKVFSPAQSPGVREGAIADLTLLRFERHFACLPVNDPGSALLTTGTPRIVDMVLVDGEVVVDDGFSSRIDHDRLTRALDSLQGSRH